ncbi:nucleotide pyrophosphohydrolase [Candidatus Saccharibacteria bacterium]|nr:nucleotide pyrophosphohydrolase [Candidatus Saccharibacteria bacterium]
MKGAQEKVKELVKKYDLGGDINVRYIDLTSEVGELGKEILEGSDYGSRDFAKTEDTEMEFGDTLFSLICVANELDIDMGEALDKALAKYARRFEEKSDIGSGR